MIEVSRPCLGQKLTALARFMGRDLWVMVEGGDAPHIGSVSLALPRLSLTGDRTGRATVSTFNLTGHKDDLVGDIFADRLASLFQCTVSVSCGLHFDDLAADRIKEVIDVAEAVLAELTDRLQALKSEASGDRPGRPTA